MLTRAVVCGYMAAARLLELAHSRRNVAAHEGSREGALSRATFPLIVLVHTAVIAGTLLRGRRHADARWLWPLAAAQLVRGWVLAVLGDRWNARGVVSPATVVETGGPYAFVRHPNYAVVAVELLCLPAAFGLGRLALAASAANAALLALRIRDEESMLYEIPGYLEHFAGKPRFIPGLF